MTQIIIRIAVPLVLILAVLIPIFAFALPTTPTAEEGSTFYPIVPLPDLPTTGATSLGEYVNAVFRLSISAAAILAVLMIMYGGFEYMTKEVTGKKDGRERIRNAVLGLVLLLIAVLILNVINPQILDLAALNAVGGQSYGEQVGANVNPTTSTLGRLDQQRASFQYIDTANPTADQVANQNFNTICIRNYGSSYQSRNTCMDRDLGLWQPTTSGGRGSTITCPTGSAPVRTCFR